MRHTWKGSLIVPVMMTVGVFVAASSVENWVLAEHYLSRQYAAGRLPFQSGLFILELWWAFARLLVCCLFVAVAAPPARVGRAISLRLLLGTLLSGLVTSVLADRRDAPGVWELVAFWSPMGIEARTLGDLLSTVVLAILVVIVAVRPSAARLRSRWRRIMAASSAAFGLVWFYVFAIPSAVVSSISGANGRWYLSRAMCVSGRALDLMPGRTHQFACEDEVCAFVALLGFLTVALGCRVIAGLLVSIAGSSGDDASAGPEITAPHRAP